MAKLNILDPEELRHALTSAAPAPVYLLGGPDGFRAERAARWLRERVLDDETSDFNSQVLYADEVAPGAIVEAASAYPMFGQTRFVWVRHAEALPSGAAIQPFLDYLKSPVNSTVLVLTSQKLDKRLKLTSACASAGCAVDFQSLGGSALVQQVRKQARAHGVELAPDTVLALVDLVGEDLGEIDTELAKLSLFRDSDDAISASEVRDLVAQSRDLDAFAVADLMDAADPLPALSAWFRLRGSGGDVIGTAAILGWRLRQLTQLRAALDQGGREGGRSIGMAPWQLRRLEPLAQSADLGVWSRSLGRLREADRRAKSTSLDAGMAYDVALLGWALDASASA